MEMLAVQVSVGGSWSLVIYGKRCQHRIFLDNGPSTSQIVLVFTILLYSGLLVGAQGQARLVLNRV